MSDKGCSREILEQLYLTEKRTLKEIREYFGVTEGVINRWLKESNITKRNKNQKYSFNENVFDSIDTPEKAYWLGFLWCDGYVAFRNNRNEYTTKLQLSVKDIKHLERFKEFLSSNHPIHTYKGKSFDVEDYESCRLMITSTYLGKKLQDDYGLVPHRSKTKKLLSKIPFELLSHFYRGVFDAEGSLTIYETSEGYLKSVFALDTYSELLVSFQEYLIGIGLKSNYIQIQKRHEDRDGEAKSLKLCGVQQDLSLMELLYKEATIYLPRKFDKFLCLKTKNEVRNVQINK